MLTADSFSPTEQARELKHPMASPQASLQHKASKRKFIFPTFLEFQAKSLDFIEILPG